MNSLAGIALAMSFSLGANAAETGRYQALPLGAENSKESPRVLIVDSRDGHLWVWSENALTTDESGARKVGTALVYQGKLRPGNKAGELIERP